MAIGRETPVTRNAESSISSNDYTFSALTLVNGSGNDRYVRVFVNTKDSTIILPSAVTFDGTAMTQLFADDTDGGQGGSGSAWGINDASLPATSGTYDVVVTVGGSPPDCMVELVEYTNIDQATPTGATDTTTLANQSEPFDISVTLTGESGNYADLLYSAGDNAAISSETSTVPGTEGSVLFGGRAYMHTAYVTSVASASETYTWTIDTNTSEIQASVAGVVALREAAGGGGVTIPIFINNYRMRRIA